MNAFLRHCSFYQVSKDNLIVKVGMIDIGYHWRAWMFMRGGGGTKKCFHNAQIAAKYKKRKHCNMIFFL